jgi:hypothetical protein
MKKKYYSYKTFQPEVLSDTYVSPHNELFQNLTERSDEELRELGFIEVELPEGLYNRMNNPTKYPTEEDWTKTYTWYRDPMGFQIGENSLEDIKRNIDYSRFWVDFSKITAYNKIREQSMSSLPINTVVTELIYLFIDAKSNRPYLINVDRIQSCFDFIFANVEFSEVELQEIQEIFVGTGMHYQYTITNGN